MLPRTLCREHRRHWTTVWIGDQAGQQPWRTRSFAKQALTAVARNKVLDIGPKRLLNNALMLSVEKLIPQPDLAGEQRVLKELREGADGEPAAPTRSPITVDPDLRPDARVGKLIRKSGRNSSSR